MALKPPKVNWPLFWSWAELLVELTVVIGLLFGPAIDGGRFVNIALALLVLKHVG